MTWNGELTENITSLEQLEASAGIAFPDRERLQRVLDRHPMSITPYYLSLIDWGDPADPIRKMAVPSQGEMSALGSYDPSGERENTRLRGVQHKYSHTALILTTNRCATYCRHCFRKRLVGRPTREVLDRFEEAADYIESHREISNVLLSGGDPLVLSTHTITAFLDRLSSIEHLDFIRFGTRVPVVLPQRITEDTALTAILREYSRPDRRVYVVTQFNHPREITQDSTAAVDALLRSGVVVNNQAVLLRGVNDDPGILADLLRRVVGIGVNPYYVFQCRPVRRVKSVFQVPLAVGYRIVEDAKALLDGHSKRFKYVMSHRSGKIEVVGIARGEIYMRYHEAKRAAMNGMFFRRKLVAGAGWLDELMQDREEPLPSDSAGRAIS